MTVNARPDLEIDLSPDAIRDDFIPVADYANPDFQQLEYLHVWPRTWQVACRLEELKGNGSYVTYDIGDQSIIVVRTSDDTIRAYHNVCKHRGRRLVEDHGKMPQFRCGFHGWRWDIEGNSIYVQDHADWGGCPSMSREDLALSTVQVDTWGGFVWINMAPDAEPLREFLSPVPDYLDCFELDRMRYRWYYSVKVPCNWKVGLEAFVEGYHVFATHPQWPPFLDDLTFSETLGKHGKFTQGFASPFGQPSPRLKREPVQDVRENLIAFYDDLNTTLAALYSERATEAVRRLRAEVPADAPHEVVLGEMFRFIREAAIACGAGWPDISFEQMGAAGTGWNIFPNIAILIQPDAALCYRLRPWANDPDFCIFDVWSLQRYAPGAEPILKRVQHYGNEDWQRIGDVSSVLVQDFSNMAAVQAGMKSYGFKGCRPNPVQEKTVSHHHRVLREYMRS